MKFSTRTTYGLRSMIRLADAYGREKIPLSKVSKEEGISLSYLERIFAGLKKGGLVKAEIGAAGGYELARNPSKITVFDVIEVLEGDITTFNCIGKNGKVNCPRSCKCPVTDVLVKVQNSVYQTLKAIKLSEIS